MAAYIRSNRAQYNSFHADDDFTTGPSSLVWTSLRGTATSAMAGAVRQHSGIWHAVRTDPFEESATQEWMDPPVESEEEAKMVRHWSKVRCVVHLPRSLC
eukprot:scaffold41800_cov258-Isochrysis_galbana.AAC.6